MKKLGIIIVGCLAFGSGIAATPNEVASTGKIKQQVHTAFPELVVDKVQESPVTGLYELTSGPVILYASHDGRYLIAGDILDLERTDDRNITEASRKKARVAALKNIPQKEMIIYRPQGTAKAVVTVFTDVGCTYCQKLHEEIPELLNLGIELRYLAFPRQGEGSPNYTKMTSIWCTKDRKTAMTQAMQGKELKTLSCPTPINQQHVLGQRLGINGTPTLIFADGTLWGGYLPAAKLAKEAIKHILKE